MTIPSERATAPPFRGVLGETYQDAVGAILGTGYLCFASPTGVRGLARPNGTRLDILAVNSVEMKQGRFRAFIAACKAEFTVVTVWEIWNPFLAEVLSRYGFVAVAEVEQGESLTGMRWTRAVIDQPPSADAVATS